MTAPQTRSAARLRAHYDIERELANRLRGASKAERRRLYAECYDELFRRVPDHPQLVRKADPAEQRAALEARSNLISHFLGRDSVFMEIGPGDCSLTMAMCSRVSQAYAVDVSTEITSRLNPPSNFELLLSDGTNIPLPDGSIDVAFSYQLIEHLHASDAAEHVREVHRVLRAGGIYVCVTPNGLNGPHDISRYFSDVPAGFHMREYTNEELSELFRANGFRAVDSLISIRGRVIRVPRSVLWCLERAIACLPANVRRSIASAPILFRLLGVTMRASR